MCKFYTTIYQVENGKALSKQKRWSEVQSSLNFKQCIEATTKKQFLRGEKKDFCLDVRKPKSKKSCFPIVNQKKGNLKSRNDFFSFENENRETTTKKPLFNFILSL